MDLSEINSVLASAENIPVIGGIVRDLQEAVQIMTEIPVNSAVFTEQATNLSQLFNEGTQLANELNTTLSQLRQSDSWQGSAADNYLGPPGARGPSSGTGGQLAVNMHQILGTVAVNKIAHTNSASFIDQVNGLQIFLWGEVVVAVVTVGLVVAATASIIGAPADVGLVPAATVETAAATTTAGTIATMTTTTTVLTTSLETVVTEAEAQLAAAYVVAAPLAFGALALQGGAVLVAEIGLALISISLVNASDHGTPTSVDPQPDPLTPDQQAEIKRLTTQFPNVSESTIEWMVRNNIPEPSIIQTLTNSTKVIISEPWTLHPQTIQSDTLTLEEGLPGPDGLGLQHILSGHGGDFKCWGINDPTNNPADRQKLINLIQALIEQIKQGGKTVKPRNAGNDNTGYYVSPFNFGGGKCPIVIIIGKDGRIITVYLPAK